MIYKIEYDVDLEKALKKVPKHDAKSIRDKIETLKKDPRPQGSVKLSGKDVYRVRVGDYRIIYAIIDDVLLVLILDVDGRKDIYKKK